MAAVRQCGGSNGPERLADQRGADVMGGGGRRYKDGVVAGRGVLKHSGMRDLILGR